ALDPGLFSSAERGGRRAVMRMWYGVRRGGRRIGAHAADQGYRGTLSVLLYELRLQRASARACRAREQHLQVLAGCSLARSHGFTARELNVIRRIIEAHRSLILEVWHEHCG